MSPDSSQTTRLFWAAHWNSSDTMGQVVEEMNRRHSQVQPFGDSVELPGFGAMDFRMVDAARIGLANDVFVHHGILPSYDDIKTAIGLHEGQDFVDALVRRKVPDSLRRGRSMSSHSPSDEHLRGWASVVVDATSKQDPSYRSIIQTVLNERIVETTGRRPALSGHVSNALPWSGVLEGNELLVWAAANGQRDLVRLLLRHGVDIESNNQFG